MGIYKEWSFAYITFQAAENSFSKRTKSEALEVFPSLHKALHFFLLEINAPKSSLRIKEFKNSFPIKTSFPYHLEFSVNV